MTGIRSNYYSDVEIKIGFNMEKSENLRDFEQLYKQVCKIFKSLGNMPVPTKEHFYNLWLSFHQLFEGHRSLLIAIGKL